MMKIEKLTPQKAYKNRPKKWIYNLLLFAVFVGIVIYSIISSDLGSSRAINWERLQNLGNGFINPNVEFLLGIGPNYSGKNFVYSVPYLTLQTIAIAFIGTIIAAILAIPLVYYSTNVVGNKISNRRNIINYYSYFSRNTISINLFGYQELEP